MSFLPKIASLPTRVHNPNSILIGSAVVAGLMTATDKTDHATRSVKVGRIYVRSTAMQKKIITRMWANAQPDGRPAEHRWRPLFNAAKFG